LLRALHDVDPFLPVTIEHEQVELNQLEGLRVAAHPAHRAGGGI
jgi:hypothetical protein